MQASKLTQLHADVVMLIGIPGCGKTTYAKNMLYDYVHVSLDINRMCMNGFTRHKLKERYDQENPLCLGLTYSTMPKNPACTTHDAQLSTTQNSNSRQVEYIQISDILKSGRNVVIDDTNLTQEVRWPYIRLARLYNASIHAVSFYNFKQAFVWNRKRTGKERVPEKIIRKHYHMLEFPGPLEGFDFVTRWNL